MPPNAYGEMFILLPIYAAAVLLGLISGVVAVHVFITTTGRLSLRALMGIIVLAAFVSGLVAAKPAFWWATMSFWGMATVVMAAIDFSVIYLLDPCRATRRFSKQPVHRKIAWSALGIAVVISGVLAILKLCFDIPLRTAALPSFAAWLVVAVLILAGFDAASHLVVIRWKRYHPTGRA